MYGKEIFPNVETDEELNWRCKVEELICDLDRDMARNDVVLGHYLAAYERGAQLEKREIEILLAGAARLSDDANALRQLFFTRTILGSAPSAPQA
jgi:hypothetical protein